MTFRTSLCKICRPMGWRAPVTQTPHHPACLCAGWCGRLEGPQPPRTQAILKKNSVSGVAAGWFKNVRMGTFFSFLQKMFFFQKWTIFSYQKKLRKKKKKMRPPYWLQKRTPAGPETEVFFRLASLLSFHSTCHFFHHENFILLGSLSMS